MNGIYLYFVNKHRWVIETLSGRLLDGVSMTEPDLEQRRVQCNIRQDICED